MAFYEWWCPHCRVTHPPGRKVCVHCGGRVQPSRDVVPTFPPLGEHLGLPAPGGAEPEPAEADEAPAPRGVQGARLAMTLVWIAVAVLASLLRMCQERG